ncbi:MAG: HupE/UreJ family protein [Candidatus Hydrogenedentes bacterium]|nr:HupE/UreJ family protein [Candidatus Hydrogenedentota bacterium]
MALSLAGVAFGHGDHSAPLAHREAHLLPLPDQAIALVALAIVFARLETDSGVAPLWTLCLAIVGSVIAGARSSFGLVEYARAIPLIVIGLLLIDPWERSKGWPRTVIALAGTAAGLSYGATLTPDINYFVHAVFFSSLGIMSAVIAAASWKRFYRPWLRIAAKIGGSWMAAIGTILLGGKISNHR